MDAYLQLEAGESSGVIARGFRVQKGLNWTRMHRDALYEIGAACFLSRYSPRCSVVHRAMTCQKYILKSLLDFPETPFPSAAHFVRVCTDAGSKVHVPP